MGTDVMKLEKCGFSCSCSCSFTYCTCLTWCIICTLRRFVLELITKPNLMELSVLQKVHWTLGTIFMKLVQVFLT